MKIYEVNGRKVWLDKAPMGYEEKKPEKAEPKKVEEPKKDVEPKTKAKSVPSNKGRKARNNK